MLGIIFLIFVGLIAYIHWIQGLLSGFISAVIAIISAAVALSFYEPLAAAMSGGKFQDQAYAVTLIALFAITYIVLRVLFDKFVPGNIRLPATVDKVGGALFGDRKSTRLNSSHGYISYAVFCLKKKRYR